MPTSKEIRAQIVSSIVSYAGNNPDDYEIYMIACSIGWYLRDSPTGMSTINQVKVVNFIHDQISVLADNATEEDDDLINAHVCVHDLRDYLIQKLKDKGTISVDDHGFKDDGLIEKHAEDFNAWAAELPPFSTEDQEK